MPNYVENELTVTAKTQTELQDFLNSVSGTRIDKNEEPWLSEDKRGIPTVEKIPFDFNSIVPMPESLNVENGTQSSLGYTVLFGSDSQINSVLSFPWIISEGITTRTQLLEFVTRTRPESLILGKQLRENELLFGSQTWYDWRIKNWGTKWDASDISIENIKVLTKVAKVLICFKTAWSPPNPVILAASEKFPNLTFKMDYFECGMQFKGVLKIKNGDILKDETSKYYGRKGG
jgi:hypothetical protein